MKPCSTRVPEQGGCSPVYRKLSPKGTINIPRVTIKLFIASRLENVMAAVGAMTLRNQGRPLLTFLLAQVRVAVGKMRLGYVKPAISYLAWCSRIARAQGLKGLVLTLKALNTSLAQSIARDLTSFPTHPRVRRGRLGLPAVIPILHRVRIANGDTTVIRYWFTLFSIYRVIEFPGKISVGTITDPGPSLDQFLPEWSAFAAHFWKSLISIGALAGDFSSLKFLKTLTVRPFLIARSTPSNVLYLSTSPLGLIAAAQAWLNHPELLQLFRDWVQLTGNSRFSNWFEGWLKVVPTLTESQFGTGSLGKLGLKDEPAGKIRVFAMVDPFTQWVMKPLHDFLFGILRKIPQDGTFDQLAPVRKLQDRGKTRFWSFDLSAATDRLPVLLQGTLLSHLITAWGATLWMGLLTGRRYALPLRAKHLGTHVTYAVGQPMGALTSWAMLALTHHALVQFSAWSAGVLPVGRWFEDYAVLGDDIVIADPAVSTAYQELMARLGVAIQLSKSVRDAQGYGVLEFAKRVFYRRESVGPVPLLEVLAAAGSLPAWLELVRKYSLTLTQGLMVLGFGYRAVSRVNQLWTAMPRRLQGYVVSYYGPGGPGFEGDILGWISQGQKDLKPVDDQFLRDLVAGLLIRCGDFVLRARALTKLVEVDRTRAHYGTSRWESWQLPKFLSILDPKYSGPNFPDAVRKNPDGIWLPRLVGDLSQDQIRALMGMIEFCYRDAFFDLLSELRDIERSLALIQTEGDFTNLPSVISTFQEVEDRISRLGLAPSLTIRKPEVKLSSFVRGGVWLRRWRSWMKAKRADQ